MHLDTKTNMFLPQKPKEFVPSLKQTLPAHLKKTKKNDNS